MGNPEDRFSQEVVYKHAQNTEKYDIVTQLHYKDIGNALEFYHNKML